MARNATRISVLMSVSLLFLSLLPIFVNAQTVSFQKATSFAVGSHPVYMAEGDLNGDGKLDLVIANHGSYTNDPNDPGSVAILLGNGDGTFQQAQFLAVGGHPQTVVVGDFNGDGKLDLVVGTFTGNNFSVSVLLGNGDGTFQAAVNYAGVRAEGAADFNGDGKLDLYGGSGVFLGNGDGSFQSGYFVGLGPGHPEFRPGQSTAGDFNGDGKLDLDLTNTYPAPNGVWTFLGNGDGTFQPAKFSFTNSPYYPTFAAPGDFNGDGKPDLAVTETNDLGPGGAVAVLLGLGDGTFTTGQLYSGVAQPGSVAVGDFNGDGKLDLAVGNSSAATVSVLLSNGDGSFQSALPFDTNGVVGLQGDSLVVGDFNGDGKPDLAVAEFSSNVVSILINNTRTASYTLAVSETGNGSGLVTSSPSGINCEPSCSASYISGTPVTLTAQVATGSDFAGWSGCDTASGATCSLTMNAAKSVTASFNLQRFALTVSKVGTGSSGERSTVTSSSSSPGAATVDCGSSCSAIYDWGTAVTLTANPANGFRVAGWTGCATVSGATCTVTISGAKSVTASFEPQGFVHRP